MKALILSGGTGTRLRPITYSCAKQLIPVANKPILFYIIEKVAKAGIMDIGIIVGETHEQIKEAVGRGDRWNVSITYIYQPVPSGLAHAVKTASCFLGEEDFLMILGDNLFHMELDNFIENFYSSSANASILLHKVADPSQFGVAVIENGKITQLVEKPPEFVSDLIITGVYIFDKNIFPAIDAIKPSRRGELEITDAIQKLLETGYHISYELTQGWWKDTGKPDDILEANRLVLSDIKSMFDSTPDNNSVLKDNIQLGKNVIVKNSIIHGPAVIGDNSVIAESFIGSYTSVGSQASIKKSSICNSIILSGTRIENTSRRMSNCLIGKNVFLKGTGDKSYSICLIVGDNCELYI